MATKWLRSGEDRANFIRKRIYKGQHFSYLRRTIKNEIITLHLLLHCSRCIVTLLPESIPSQDTHPSAQHDDAVNVHFYAKLAFLLWSTSTGPLHRGRIGRSCHHSLQQAANSGFGENDKDQSRDVYCLRVIRFNHLYQCPRHYCPFSLVNVQQYQARYDRAQQ